MTPGRFHFVSQVGRVPSMIVPLDAQQEVRFQRLMEESIMGFVEKVGAEVVADAVFDYNAGTVHHYRGC